MVGGAAPRDAPKCGAKSGGAGSDYCEVWNELAQQSRSIMRPAGQADTMHQSDSTEPITISPADRTKRNKTNA